MLAKLSCLVLNPKGPYLRKKKKKKRKFVHLWIISMVQLGSFLTQEKRDPRAKLLFC